MTFEELTERTKNIPRTVEGAEQIKAIIREFANDPSTSLADLRRFNALIDKQNKAKARNTKIQ